MTNDSSTAGHAAQGDPASLHPGLETAGGAQLFDGDRMAGMPPEIIAMVRALIDQAKIIAGPNPRRQFALILTALGEWMADQDDSKPWLILCADTIGKHMDAIDAGMS